MFGLLKKNKNNVFGLITCIHHVPLDKLGTSKILRDIRSTSLAASLQRLQTLSRKVQISSEPSMSFFFFYLRGLFELIDEDSSYVNWPFEYIDQDKNIGA